MKNSLILFILAIILKPVLPVVEYVINYDYIVKELCENKAKPELKCNGKCHLMKEMAKASEAEKPLQNDKKTLHQEAEILFFQEIEQLDLMVNNFSKDIKNIHFYTNCYSHLNNFSIFHPPTINS